MEDKSVKNGVIVDAGYWLEREKQHKKARRRARRKEREQVLRDWCEVALIPWKGAGVRKLLYYGVVDGSRFSTWIRHSPREGAQ